MSSRLDVRRMLLRRGWTEDREGFLHKGGALWTATNNAGDSGVDGPGKRWSVTFDNDVPARIIVATCEAAATVRAAGAP